MSFSLADAAHDAGRATALVIDGETLSFADLARAVAPVRAELRNLVGAVDRPVALRASPRRGTLLAIYAMLEEGIPFVPLHARLAESEALRLANDLGAVATLDDSALASFEQKAPSTTLVEKNRQNDDRTLLAIVFTSGTSGTSRGAMLTRAAFAASARASALNLPWHPHDRWLLCMPLAHVGGLSIVMRCLLGRRAVVFLPKFDVDAVLGSIVSDQVTRVSVVPTMLFDLLARDRDNVLARLETILLGGAAASPSLLEECARRGLRVLTTYGLTEACSQVTTQAPHDPHALVRGSGHPLEGIQLHITHSGGVLCKPGEIGSISLRGPSLMRGYVGEPLLGDAFFDTGDLGFVDDLGSLHLVSRKKDLVITGGENVYPLQVEAALLACDGVEAAVVFGVSDAKWGERVAAALVVGPSFDEARAYAKLRAELAGFQLPRSIVVAAELPKSESGKIARAEVARVFSSQLRSWRTP